MYNTYRLKHQNYSQRSDEFKRGYDNDENINVSTSGISQVKYASNHNSSGNVRNKVVINHEGIMVSAKNQFINADVGNLRDFAAIIYEKAIITDETKDNPSFEKSLFTKSFKDLKIAKGFHSFALTVAKQNGIKSAVILPPLILRSEDDVVFRFTNLMIICHKSGPIIPLVEQTKVKDSQEVISRLYNLHSTIFVNAENFNTFLHQ